MSTKTGTTNRLDASTCPACPKSPGFHAGLHVGHVWTDTSCPAYRTLDGSDCTCPTS